MKVSELRIGNWIFDDDGILSKVIGFEPFDDSIGCNEEEGCTILIDLYPQVGDVMKGYCVESNLCKPVPLTEERLVTLGFEQCGYEGLSRRHQKLKGLDFAGINWADAEFPEYQFLTVSIGEEIYKIYWVHQLQNLFSVLTGEELTLSEF